MHSCNLKHILLSLLALPLFISCSEGGDQFSTYQREPFGEVAIGSATSKQIILQNPSTDSVQHLVGLNFDAGENQDGHFRIDKVELSGVAVSPKNKDISIPAGSMLQVYVTYQPRNLDTTVADYGGWSTGEKERFVPHEAEEEDTSAVKAMSSMISKSSSAKQAIHRAILVAVYDRPEMGITQVELIGEAVPGPNGEVSALGGEGAGECPTTGGTLCYKGGFALELPDIMTGGPKPLNMTGPAVFNISGASVSIDMGTFPAVLLVLKGNGPGEPLEGKPINAISLVISGTEGVTAKGTYDGSKLEVTGVAFRIRVVLGEITEKDINPGLQAAVDFDVKDLKLTTTKPYTNGAITLSVEATLTKTPSGNAMFDQFLGGTRVLVTMDGNLTTN